MLYFIEKVAQAVAEKEDKKKKKPGLFGRYIQRQSEKTKGDLPARKKEKVQVGERTEIQKVKRKGMWPFNRPINPNKQEFEEKKVKVPVYEEKEGEEETMEPWTTEKGMKQRKAKSFQKASESDSPVEQAKNVASAHRFDAMHQVPSAMLGYGGGHIVSKLLDRITGKKHKWIGRGLKASGAILGSRLGKKYGPKITELVSKSLSKLSQKKSK